MQETKEIQYLRLAKEKFVNGDIDDAEACYEMAFLENPDNPEAKFFHNFYDFMKQYQESNIKEPFISLILSLDSAVKYVAENDWSDREKSIAIIAMKSLYMCIPDYIITAYNSLSIDLIEDCIMSLYWFGTYIKTYFKEDRYYMEIAVELWKKAIQLHQEYGCTYDNYKIEDYATEISKIEPDYTVPENPAENARERKAREEAEKAEKKAHEERENTERKAREEAEKAEKAKKDKIKFIIIAAIIAAIAIIGGLLPYIPGN